MSTPGYIASLKKSGTSTAFSDEPMSNTSGNIWEIDDINKEVFDRVVTPVFYDNAVPIIDTDIESVNYLYGHVTFTGVKVGPITVDGSYMPLADIAGAKEGTLNLTSSVHDVTDLSNEGYHNKITGMHDSSVSLSRWDDLSKDFSQVLNSREPIVIEYKADEILSFRGWYILESSGKALNLTGVIEETLSFQLDGDDTEGKTFSSSDI